MASCFALGTNARVRLPRALSCCASCPTGSAWLSPCRCLRWGPCGGRPALRAVRVSALLGSGGLARHCRARRELCPAALRPRLGPSPAFRVDRTFPSRTEARTGSPGVPYEPAQGANGSDLKPPGTAFRRLARVRRMPVSVTAAAKRRRQRRRQPQVRSLMTAQGLKDGCARKQERYLRIAADGRASMASPPTATPGHRSDRRHQSTHGKRRTPRLPEVSRLAP
jgi:hypothetical protein